MGLTGTNPASGRLVIRDDYMDAQKDNKNSEINLKDQTPSAAFAYNNNPRSEMAFFGKNAPRGLSIDGTAADAEAFHARLNCAYTNDPQAAIERFACGVTHPVMIEKIYPYGSTARGIKVKI